MTLCVLRGARSIQALLSAPNPDDPLAENVARHWKDNEAEAVATGACHAPSLLHEVHAAVSAGACGGAKAVGLCVGVRNSLAASLLTCVGCLPKTAWVASVACL